LGSHIEIADHPYHIACDSDWRRGRYWKLSPRLSGTFIEIGRLKDNGVTTLTFWGHVTSSVTWSFDSRWSTSYGWSIVTMRLTITVIEI